MNWAALCQMFREPSKAAWAGNFYRLKVEDRENIID
jgi:hypothetical protein